MSTKRVVFLLIFTLLLPTVSMSQSRDANKVYKVAILPFAINSEENLDYIRQGVYDILSTRVSVEGRIIVLDRTLVERALYEERPMRLDEDAAKKIGYRAGADFIVLGSITKIGNYISLDARMISVTEDKPPLSAFTQHKGLEDVMVKVGDFAQEIGMKILGRRQATGRGDSKRSFFQPGDSIHLAEGARRSQTFDFEIVGIDAGDVDGDKKNEVVVMDTNNLYIFKFADERLTLFRKLQLAPGNNFLSLDVADINRNGYAEIIVTNMVDDNLRSFILEFEEGNFRKVTEKSGWCFRVLQHPKEGAILAGQQMDSEGMISGPIYRMNWKKKEYVQGPKIDLPPDTKLFGLALYDRGAKGGLPDPVILDDFGRLRVVDPKGKYVWSSTDHFGGTSIFYDTKRKRDPVYRGGEAPPWRVFIPARVVVRDLDGDGVPEVIVNRNYDTASGVLNRVRAFEKGEMYNLVWEENSFITNWKTREIPGYLVDFQIRDIDNDGDDELIVAVVNPSGVMDRKSTSNVFFFKLF
jgi:TolB-like protein